MRKATRWLLSLAVLIGTAGAGSVPAGAATAAGPETEDIKDRILAIPGMSLVEEKPVDGYRYFVTPSRSEPTKIIDGNQVSMEYRYFTPSRPTPTDWKKLDIRQDANDQHRIFRALHRIYDKNWIDTGGSKGGMTATYYRRFFPD
ncbi:tripeptidyl aminopeptidase, partial [Streptomyces platensis subsp. clarensis]|nr:tripeptidyl aminopeptidase [Streptomyces platensis subsp. clarensis]